MKAGMTIGELAGELQLNPKTIRYYEEVEFEKGQGRDGRLQAVKVRLAQPEGE